MESVFRRFDSYDFESDGRFQDGLKNLDVKSLEENKLLDVKLFFYNRFTEPIDQSSYKQWRSSFPQTTVECMAEQLDKKTFSETESRTAESSTESEMTQLSFAEVMKLVQEGKEVPGVKKLDIKPTNQSPTPSQMGRILKPWELSSLSK